MNTKQLAWAITFACSTAASYAATWNPVPLPPSLTEAAELLQGYNYVLETNAKGRPVAVNVSGKNGSGRDAAVTPIMPTETVSHQITFIPFDIADLPEELRSYPPGAVIRISLPENLHRMRAGEKLSLALPTGEYAYIHDHAVRHENGDQTWIGSAERDGDSFRAVLTSGGKGTIGSFNTPDGEFLVEAAGDGSAWMIDVRRAGLQLVPNDFDHATPPTAGDLPMESVEALVTPKLEAAKTFKKKKFAKRPKAKRTAKSAFKKKKNKKRGRAQTSSPSPAPIPAADPEAPTTIDVLVLYTPNFASGNYDTRINYLVTVANQAYADSHIPLTLRIVGRQPISYPEDDSNTNALTAITSAATAFVNVPQLRSQYGADLVVLLRPFHLTQGSCGAAWVNGSGTGVMSSAYGYSEVSDGREGTSYCQDITFVHELGHNLGNVHDREHSHSPGIYSYSYAWGVNGKYGTIMSYYQPMVNKFAGPDLTCTSEGDPCGYDQSDVARASDNVLTIKQTAPITASFMPKVVP